MWLNQFISPASPPLHSRNRPLSRADRHAGDCEGRLQFHPSRQRAPHHPGLPESPPLEADLHHCRLRIAEEQALAQAAGSPEAGLVHEQVAMLYRSQLATLLRQQRHLLADAAPA